MLRTVVEYKYRNIDKLICCSFHRSYRYIHKKIIKNFRRMKLNIRYQISDVHAVIQKDSIRVNIHPFRCGKGIFFQSPQIHYAALSHCKSNFLGRHGIRTKIPQNKSPIISAEDIDFFFSFPAGITAGPGKGFTRVTGYNTVRTAAFHCSTLNCCRRGKNESSRFSGISVTFSISGQTSFTRRYPPLGHIYRRAVSQKNRISSVAAERITA